jgi:hypothetical protein
MTSLQNRLAELKAALVEVTDKCYHYFAPSTIKAPYIVWAEEGEELPFQADNFKQEQTSSGFVEYFTAEEFDAVFDAIQAALNGIEGLSWTWESTQYGDPTHDDDNLIHHTWSWRMY